MLLIALCKIVRSLLLKSLFTGNFILCISIHFLLRGYLLGIGSAISKYILEISDGDLLWWQIWSYSSQLVKSCWSYRKFIKNDSGRSSTLTANIIQINDCKPMMIKIFEIPSNWKWKCTEKFKSPPWLVEKWWIYKNWEQNYMQIQLNKSHNFEWYHHFLSNNS